MSKKRTTGRSAAISPRSATNSGVSTSTGDSISRTSWWLRSLPLR
ncbi:hypothetical protein [Amycolatopsis sp. CA-128772]|nr:hypothetical protein [Amycolatopsis sp. CA-128772]